MGKHYAALSLIFLGLLGVVYYYTMGKGQPINPIGTNPGPDTTVETESLGPKYLTYNLPAFNPGPPVNNFTMPSSTSALGGVQDSSCTCPQMGGRF